MEKAYDFHELVSCANTMNHLLQIEYGGNGNGLAGHITRSGLLLCEPGAGAWEPGSVGAGIFFYGKTGAQKCM